MNLRNALEGIKDAQPAPAAEVAKPRKAKPAQVASPLVREITTRRLAGKSSQPDYEKVGVYVRTELRRKAFRKFEDAGGRDFSDLIETLLTSYLGD